MSRLEWRRSRCRWVDLEFGDAILDVRHFDFFAIVAEAPSRLGDLFAVMVINLRTDSVTTICFTSYDATLRSMSWELLTG